MRVLEGGEARRELRRGGAPRVEPVRRGEGRRGVNHPSQNFVRQRSSRGSSRDRDGIEMASALPPSFLRSLPTAERASLLGRVEDAALRERLITFFAQCDRADASSAAASEAAHRQAELDAARRRPRLTRRSRPTRPRLRAAPRRSEYARTWRSARRPSRPRPTRQRRDVADERRAAAARAAARETPHTEPVPQPPPPPPSAHAPPHAPLLSAPALHALVPTLNPDAKAWLDDTRTAAQKQFAQQRQVAELAKAVVALNQRASSADARARAPPAGCGAAVARAGGERAAAAGRAARPPRAGLRAQTDGGARRAARARAAERAESAGRDIRN